MYIEYRVYIIIYRNVYVINSQNYIQIQKNKKKFLANFIISQISLQDNVQFFSRSSLISGALTYD